MTQQVAAGPRAYRVGEVVAGVRQLLEDRVGRLWVTGQVSNLSRPRSGHLYFTLVDERGQLRAALFRGNAQRLRFEPEEGLEVLAYGDLTVYEARGDLQLIVRQLEPRGVGALQVAFEQLRRRLEAEGLFDAARKRPLPLHPERIGVVTSGSGAALRDVLEVSGRRRPDLPLLLALTRVQGIGAEQEIASALAAVSRRPGVSLVLLVRGGGSLEDLQPFNTEEVARAIAACPVPVVAGVGHEVDVTIADLVADLRAPTPSAAAELAVPDGAALRDVLRAHWRHPTRAMHGRHGAAHARLDRLATAVRAQSPLARLAANRQRLVASARALERAVSAVALARRRRLSESAVRLESLSPLAVLGRGYALVRRIDDGTIVRRAAEAPPGTRLAIRVDRAELEARVESAQERAPDDAPR